MQNLFRRWTERLKSPRSSHYPLESQSGCLRLRPFLASEITLVEEWFEDRETCELAFGVKAPWETLCAMRSDYLKELQNDMVGVLSIEHRQEDEDHSPIGFVRYKLFKKARKKHARVGILLGPSALRGRGLGREAFDTLLDYLFTQRQVTQIELDTALFNTKAQACFESCGFVVLREMEFTSIDTNWTERRLVMRLTPETWKRPSSD